MRRNEWRRYWGDFVAAAVAKQGWPETCLDGIVDYSWQQEYMRFMFILMDTNGKYCCGPNWWTLYILIYFLAFRSCVRNSLSCHSRWTYRHDFWHGGVFRLWHADFWKIRVEGQKSRSKMHENRPFLGRFWSQGLYVGQFITREGQVG